MLELIFLELTGSVEEVVELELILLQLLLVEMVEVEQVELLGEWLALPILVEEEEQKTLLLAGLVEVG
jgi:hypothetical protein